MLPRDLPIRVIVADDHAIVRAGIANWIQREADLEVVAQASNGHEALHLIAAHKPDVLLTDIEMPDLRGIDLVRTVQQRHPDVRTVLMTAFKGWYVQEILDMGNVGLVSKEAERETFLLAIRRAAQGRSWVDPEALQEEFGRTRELDELGLTPTERRVLNLIDRPNEEISAMLGMKETTLRKTHLTNIFFKIGVNKRHEAIAWARRKKLLGRQEA